MVAVQVEVGSLTHTLKLYQHLLVFQFMGLHGEFLPIPGNGVGQVYNVFLEGLAAIEGIG